MAIAVIRSAIANIKGVGKMPNNFNFNFDTALALLESADPFPVDFDAAWQWLGYSSKQKAKDKLINNFDRGEDFSTIRLSVSHSNGLTASRTEVIKLSLDCFKSFCMMAGTEKGKEVRRYFLKCERNLKELLTEPPSPPQPAVRHYSDTELHQFVTSTERRLNRLETKVFGGIVVTLHPAKRRELGESISAQQKILDYLDTQRGSKFSAQELAQDLNISYNSVRRVLPELCRKGLIKREFNTQYTTRVPGVPKHFYSIKDYSL